MMQKIILELDKYNHYKPIKSAGNDLWILECFLHDIIMQFFKSYLDWATDSNLESLETNSTLLEKKANNVIIKFLYSSEPGEEPVFKISIDQFIKLLQEWEKLIKTKTKKITITQNDDGTMSIEGE